MDVRDRLREHLDAGGGRPGRSGLDSLVWSAARVARQGRTRPAPSRGDSPARYKRSAAGIRVLSDWRSLPGRHPPASYDVPPLSTLATRTVPMHFRSCPLRSGEARSPCAESRGRAALQESSSWQSSGGSRVPPGPEPIRSPCVPAPQRCDRAREKKRLTFPPKAWGPATGLLRDCYVALDALFRPSKPATVCYGLNFLIRPFVSSPVPKWTSPQRG